MHLSQGAVFSLPALEGRQREGPVPLGTCLVLAPTQSRQRHGSLEGRGGRDFSLQLLTYLCPLEMELPRGW